VRQSGKGDERHAALQCNDPKESGGGYPGSSGFFGEEGVGLTADEQGPCCAYFEGSGGFVRATASTGEDEQTVVELETREWDYSVKQFMSKIG
jgi:hypothetical protein